MTNRKTTKARITKAIAKAFGLTIDEAKMAVYLGKEDPGQWAPDADFIIHLEGLGLPYETRHGTWEAIAEEAGIWIEPYNNAVLCAYHD